MKINSKKQIDWGNMAAEVNKFTDRLGMPVDEGIKETVIAINLLGFKTSGSCGGHLDHGVSGPWVDIKPKDFVDLSKQLDMALDMARGAEKEGKPNIIVDKLYKKYHSLILKERKPLLEEARRFTTLLDEFHSSHKTSYDNILIVRIMRESFRVENLGVYLQDIASLKTKQQKLGEFQNEMRAFTKFLKAKFFS